jgi:hypothetical protein
MNQFCFCTLAIGDTYNNLALLLAQDINKYAPGKSFIILTDKPDHFKQQTNVIAYYHHPQSSKIYNDKRFVLQKALEFYDSCIFVDANIRLLEKLPENLNFTSGIVAYSSSSIIKFNNRVNSKSSQYFSRYFQLIKKVCFHFKIDIEKVKYIQEYFFYVTKNENFYKFLSMWELLAGYFELRRIYIGEGNIIGLSAAIAEFPIFHDYEKKIKFFKDRIYLSIRKKQQTIINDLELLLQEQRKYEYPPRNIIQKIFNKLKHKSGFLVRKTILKFTSWKYRDIYQEIDKQPL